MFKRIKWWWVGLFNPFVRMMNIAEGLSDKEKRDFAAWIKADADIGKK